jgi:hypothetical protein
VKSKEVKVVHIDIDIDIDIGSTGELHLFGILLLVALQGLRFKRCEDYY